MQNSAISGASNASPAQHPAETQEAVVSIGVRTSTPEVSGALAGLQRRPAPRSGLPLPTELTNHIGSYLSHTDVHELSATSTEMYGVVETNRDTVRQDQRNIPPRRPGETRRGYIGRLYEQNRSGEAMVNGQPLSIHDLSHRSGAALQEVSSVMREADLEREVAHVRAAYPQHPGETGLSYARRLYAYHEAGEPHTRVEGRLLTYSQMSQLTGVTPRNLQLARITLRD